MEKLISTFEAWRIVRLGSREVIDAVIAPEHRGPSSALKGALAQWEGAHYWLDPDQTHLVLIRRIGAVRTERWLLHLLLLAFTIICSLGAGAALAGEWYPRGTSLGLGTVLDQIAAPFAGGLLFFRDVYLGQWRAILSGWSFSLPLLGILLIHELGHYFAARRYAIDVSPPYFLPVPPTLSPIGSLGAFIRLRTPVLDRRQLLDVGAAGPIAGFVVALAVLIWGYATSQAGSDVMGLTGPYVIFADQPIALGNSLLTEAAQRYFLGSVSAIHLNLPAFAGWVGMFVTGLNLLPLSQLDGGHVLYAMFGRRQAWIGFLALVGLIILAHSSWTWYVWVALVLLIGGGRWTHPSVLSPERPIPPRRHLVGWICILLFFLTFVPVPFRV